VAAASHLQHITTGPLETIGVRSWRWLIAAASQTKERAFVTAILRPWLSYMLCRSKAVERRSMRFYTVVILIDCMQPRAAELSSMGGGSMKIPSIAASRPAWKPWICKELKHINSHGRRL
jgi:hypothetical protein